MNNTSTLNGSVANSPPTRIPWAGCWLIGLICLVLSPSISGEDWTQYRGSNLDGISRETIRTNWTEQPPQVLWSIPLDPALSSLTIQNGRVFTLVRRPWKGREEEFCIALDSNTGQELWATPLGVADYPNGGVGEDDGPRSTPAVDGDRVFVLTSYLRLACLSVTNGFELWGRDLVAEYGSRVIPWQNAASPVVEGDLVLVNCNSLTQTMAGFAKSDGRLVWKISSEDWTTHSTPVSATIDGVRQTIFFTQTGLVSVAPETGAVLWRFNLNYNHTSVAASPVVAAHRVYGSRHYPSSLSRATAGAAVVEVGNAGGQIQASQLWHKVNQLMNHWSTPVHHNGSLYGIYGSADTQLKCVDLASGDEKWSMPGFGWGNVLLVNGLVLAQTGTGHLILVEANPEAYIEVDRVQPLTGKTWNAPAVSQGRIYARSTTQAVCLDVSTRTTPTAPLLLSVLRSPAGVQLSLGRQDGSALDLAQLGRIEFQTAYHLANGPDGWLPLTNAPVVINGQFQLELPLTNAAPQRFIRARELP